ncbi:DUF2384 domain-containing protein, partial [bacterium]|nr:DUF2384 domain-containing protein [bacterium]
VLKYIPIEVPKMTALQRLLFVDPEGNNEDDLPTMSFDVIYTRTRKAALEKLQSEKPSFVIISTSSHRSLKSLLDSLHIARKARPIIVINEAKRKEDAIEITKTAMRYGASDVILSSEPKAIRKAFTTFTSYRDRKAHAAAKSQKSDIRLLREGLGLSRKIFADLLPASEKAVQNWEEGSAFPRKSHDQLAKLLEMKQRLETLYDPDEVARWIKTPNRVLGMKRPLDLIKEGEFEQLLNMIESLEDGSHA